MPTIGQAFQPDVLLAGPTLQEGCPLNADDESTLTEITVLPDGRVYVFGASQPVLEALADLWPGDIDLQVRVQRLRALSAAPSKAGPSTRSPVA